jgi:hypothetical protein
MAHSLKKLQEARAILEDRSRLLATVDSLATSCVLPNFGALEFSNCIMAATVRLCRTHSMAEPVLDILVIEVLSIARRKGVFTYWLKRLLQESYKAHYSVRFCNVVNIKMQNMLLTLGIRLDAAGNFCIELNRIPAVARVLDYRIARYAP